MRKSLGRRALIGSWRPRRSAQDPLLPRDARIDGGSPVKAKPAPCSGAPITRIRHQFEHLGMFTGQPMNHLLLLFGERQLNRRFGAAHGALPGTVMPEPSGFTDPLTHDWMVLEGTRAKLSSVRAAGNGCTPA